MAYKLGKLAPRPDRRTLKLAWYLHPQLPKPPAAVNYGAQVSDWGMYKNDQIGDCAIASPAHMIMAWTSSAAGLFVPPEPDVLAAYSAVSGYDPVTGANDDGCVMLDVLKYWASAGIAGRRIAGFTSANIRSPSEIKTALWLFGGLDVGLQLPLSAQDQDLWEIPPAIDSLAGDAAPGSWGGHAVCVVGYDVQGLTVVTWGAPKRMTWPFFFAYCDEAYLALSDDFLIDGKSPAGFDLVTLQRDLQAVRGMTHEA
jgi:hypothetical protein